MFEKFTNFKLMFSEVPNWLASLCVVAIISITFSVFMIASSSQLAKVTLLGTDTTTEHTLNWINISENEYNIYYTKVELETINQQKCESHPYLKQICCIGGTSSGGSTYWNPKQCLNKNIPAI